jgi:SpoVK/Ycf46/Vps4 family AAA+-type ATPase
MKADTISMKNFEEALKKVRPSVSKEIEDAYKDLQNQFKAEKVKQLKEEKPVYMG